MLRLRPSIVLLLAGLVPLGTGCVWASGTARTFEWRVEPVAATPVPDEAPLSPTEIRYARDTVRIVFKRRGGERTLGFVSASGGYALCLRSGKDYALLVFARRIFDEAISQAADDNTILRSPSDTAICRQSRLRWVAV